MQRLMTIVVALKESKWWNLDVMFGEDPSERKVYAFIGAQVRRVLGHLIGKV